MPLNLSRSLLTIILPGIVATAPWLLLLFVKVTALQHWHESYAFPLHVAAFAVAVTAGSLFEGVGSYIECMWDRWRGRQETPTIGNDDWVQRDWYAYLKEPYGAAEPVGYRYLSRKVTALYFELGMMMAVPIGLVGLGMLAQMLFPSHGLVPWVFVGLAFAAALGFLKFASDTHDLLCETRHFLKEDESIKGAEVVK
jgi:hypothetical protein